MTTGRQHADNAGRRSRLPLFVDRHEGLEGTTPKEAAEAHMRDLEVQGRYGVRYLS